MSKPITTEPIFGKMRKAYIILSIIVSAALLQGCEKVITLDFNDAEPKLVVEAIISDGPGPYTVQLNESAGFYESNVFPAREGATVRIMDDLGNEETLIEVSPGIYQTINLQGELGRTYTLLIESEDEIYTATSTMPSVVVPVDTLVIEYIPENLFQDEGLYCYAYATDPAGIANYYRYNMFVNGAPYITYPENSTDPLDGKEDDNFYLSDDKYFDGNQIDIEFPNLLLIGDTMDIELHNVDKGTYDYYRTLVEAIYGGGVAPANPISNFGDSALGYFGAISIQSRQMVVE
jgi:hypothetical protein